MKNGVKSSIIICALLASLAITPCNYAKKQEVWSGKKKLAITGLFMGGLAAAGTVIYYVAKHRGIRSEPTPMNLTCFGNKNGQPILYSHGLGGYFGQAYYYVTDENDYTRNTRYYSQRYIFDPDLHYVATFNYPDSIEKNKTKTQKKMKRDQVSLGQKNDMHQLDSAATEFNQPNTLAFGVSRGAATLINLMGTNPNKHIKALILEAPFSSIKQALTHMYAPKNFFKNIPLLETTVGKFAHTFTSALFPQYSINGLQPIDTIDKIDPQIPILLVHSKNDMTCPYSGSCELYIKRKKQLSLLDHNPNNIYFLQLEETNHGKALCDTEGELFQNVVHAFYKKHGYPYNKTFASKIDLRDYQPSIEEIVKELENKR